MANFIAERLEQVEGPDAAAWLFRLQMAMGRHAEAAAFAVAAARAEQDAGNYKVYPHAWQFCAVSDHGGCWQVNG